MKILNQIEAKNYQIPALNRGHIVFTSLVKLQNKVLFIDAHIERLLAGAHFLFPENQWNEKHEVIKGHVQNVLRDVDDSYLRITIFDDVLHLEKKKLPVSLEEVKLARAVKIKTPGLFPPHLKHSNYLEADLEIKNAMKSGFDDVLFFDNQGNAAEASTSNLFIVTREGDIVTPPICSYVLQGITRGKLSECLMKNGYMVVERAIGIADLEKAREIWLTNAVKGVRSVSQFQDKHFSVKGPLYEKAIGLFGRFGEKYE